MDVDIEGDTSTQKVIDVDAIGSPVAPPRPSGSAVNELPAWENRFTMDLEFEASKTALDLAIFNSCYAGSGGYDRVKKFLGQGVLLVGGGSMIKGMSQSLQSRLSSLCVPLVSSMPPVQIQPPPKDVDPRVLIWKGASVLGKMDGISELWVTKEDWVRLGHTGVSVFVDVDEHLNLYRICWACVHCVSAASTCEQSTRYLFLYNFGWFHM